MLIRNKAVFNCKNGNVSGLHFQPSQPLPRIHNLSNTRVSILPEVEEFLVMFYGFGLPAFLLDLLIILAQEGSNAAADP